MNLIGSINQQPGATQIAIAIQGTETQTNTLLPTTTGTSTSTMVPTNTPVPTPTYVVVSQMREIDQMEMVYVPAGNFIMGNDTGEADEQPVHEVYLNAFWIDKHEVTNTQYEGCVDAYICTPPLGENSYRHTNYYGSKTYAQYPVLRINWHQANNYCAWVGGRLPTEAEWEKAARGPDERLYPWGQEEPTCQLANFGGFTGCVGEVKFVGGYPAGASQYGAMDMLGNVNEWVNDWYDPGYYTMSPTEDPRGPETGENKVLRGGSFLEEKNELRLTKRYWFHPDEIPFTDYYEIGFRCVFFND
jgi:formylglycine-generating enzyme required for sulfatase activity